MIRSVVVLLTCLVCLASTAVPMNRYRKVLKSKSNKGLKKLFKELYAEKDYSASEVTTRLEYFREAVQFVVASNDNPEVGWTSDLNFFGDKSPKERSNILLISEGNGQNINGMTFPLGSNTVPTKDWVSEGYVREVGDQGEECRACWAYAAVVALEGRYQVLTNISMKFSEQELVDCVYWAEGRDQDGCYGGQMVDAFDFIKDFGHLTSESRAGYTGEVGDCEAYNSIDNSFTRAHVTGWTLVGHQDQTLIDTLLHGPIATGVQTTEAFLFYKEGVFRDTTCGSLIPNHAVGIVGYTKDSFRIKNSWGTAWGDQGYMNVARGHHGCGIIFYGVYPNIASGAPVTTDIVLPDDCRDVWGEAFCANYLDYCQYYGDYCAKSCENC